MLNEQIKDYETKLKAANMLKYEAEALAGLMKEIKSGHIASVHVSPALASQFLERQEHSIHYYTQRVLENQAILSALIKSGETEKVSA